MSEPVSGITVSGVGEVASAPDIMTVTLGVTVRDDSIAGASASARELSRALLDTLVASGVGEGDVATSNYSVFPEYDHREGTQHLLGYRVNNEMQVTIRDLPGAGDILDRSIASVGDAITVNQVTFSIDDDASAKDQAREAAWADAVHKAEHLARLAGRSLGRAEIIIESVGRAPGPRPMARMAAVADSTPIEAGTAATRVDLEVTFSLE